MARCMTPRRRLREIVLPRQYSRVSFSRLQVPVQAPGRSWPRRLRRSRGPDVLIVTNLWPRPDNPVYGIFVKRQVDGLEAAGISYEVMFIEGYRSRWEYARAAWRLFRLNWSPNRPKLIHAHGGETTLAVCWYRRSPVIVSYLGDDVLGTPRADGSLIPASRVRRLVFRNLARLLAATITKSSEMEATLPRAARGRNTVLPNGVDRALFHPRPREQARGELGWAAEDRVVLFAADPAVERKRHWLAEAACRVAEREIGPIELQVATGVSPDRIPVLMAAADCLILTSVIEGSPNVVKEAVTSSLPVVSTDAGDVRVLLNGVEPSWICDATPEALGDALVQCLCGRERSNGWERSAWFGREQIGIRLLELYRRLVPELEDGLADGVRGPQLIAGQR